MRKVRAWLTIAALLLSPLVAVGISQLLERQRERRALKYGVLTALLATRHSPFADDRLRALGVVELHFHGDPEVVRLYREYLDLLANDGLNTASGFTLRDRKLVELTDAMARSLGLKRPAPDARGWNDAAYVREAYERDQKSQTLQDAMLRFYSKMQA